jgi:hypothetical protein
VLLGDELGNAVGLLLGLPLVGVDVGELVGDEDVGLLIVGPLVGVIDDDVSENVGLLAVELEVG